MRILIGLPTYGDYLRVNCVAALMALAEQLRAYGIEAEMRFVSVARIEVARNLLASLVLREPGYSHLLFIDSDVGFRPEAVLRMIAKDTAVAACTYPSRQLNLAAFAEQARKTEDVAKALAKALTFPTLGEADGDTIDIVEGWMKVKQAPTGLMLIKREVFETLVERHPELVLQDAEYLGMPERGLVLQCFSPYQREDGLLMGEDVSFCRRWIDAGGEIQMLVDEVLSHAGVTTYEASLIQALLD